jgi:Elongation factor P (EF-P) KOW-like domain
MNCLPYLLVLCWLSIATEAFLVRPATTTTTVPPPRVVYHMVAVDTSDIKNGMTVELDGDPCKVLSFSIMKQARGAAKTTIKFKNLIRGTTLENTYRSGEKFETAMIEKIEAQYTYQEGVRVVLFCDSVCVLVVVSLLFLSYFGCWLFQPSHHFICLLPKNKTFAETTKNRIVISL